MARRPPRAAAQWRATETFLLGLPSVMLVHATLIADRGWQAMRASVFVFGALAGSLVLAILLWHAMRQALAASDTPALNEDPPARANAATKTGLAGNFGALLGRGLRVAASASLLLFLVAGMLFAIREVFVLPLVLLFLLALLLVGIQVGFGQCRGGPLRRSRFPRQGYKVDRPIEGRTSMKTHRRFAVEFKAKVAL